MSMDLKDLDAFLAGALREPAGWPDGLSPAAAVERVLFHGIAGCLAGRMGSWPREAAEPIRNVARGHAMWEVRHRQVVGRLLDDLNRAGARAILLKGTALAYDLYTSPAQRLRGDSDIVVDGEGLAQVRRILSGKGFMRADRASDTEEALSLEETWIWTAADGTTHVIDLHHHAFNAPILAGMIPFEAAWAQSRPLPALCPAARGLPLHLALLLACTHRAKHRVSPYYVDGKRVNGADRLIWLVDIDLLSRRLSAEEWDRLTSDARRHGVGRICGEALETAAHLLGTSLPPPVRDGLATASASTAATRYLMSQGLAGRLWSDFLAARGRHRLDFLRFGLFPSAAHMRAKYPDRPREPLPVLYFRRIAGFVSAHMMRTRG